VIDQTLERARAGDQDAFADLTDQYRRELQLHCYRILGSVQDAEDVLQETLLAAWGGLDGFEGRASVRAWLYRIATNRCLDMLRASRRRPEEEQRLIDPPKPTRMGEPIWLQPYPDSLLDGIRDDSPGPEARYEAKETIALAFTAGLQHLPPQQRATLVLRDVLGYRAEEVAEMLESSPAAVGRDRAPLPDSQRERDIVGSFADAVQDGDAQSVVALLTDDAWLTMPPQPFEYQGPAVIAAFLDERAERRGGPVRLIPTRANNQPAFGCYFSAHQTEVARAYGLLVLTLRADQVSAITFFADTSVFPHFGLPPTLGGAI
jgi:RNA polymerase sigma-70 factor (TIGR02960 family)